MLSGIARIAGDHDQYRAHAHRTRALLMSDKGRYVIGLAKEVESHLHAKKFRPVIES